VVPIRTWVPMCVVYVAWSLGVGAGSGWVSLCVGGVQGVRVLANSNTCSNAGRGSNTCSNLPG
jgi:hypothetical protein